MIEADLEMLRRSVQLGCFSGLDAGHESSGTFSGGWSLASTDPSPSGHTRTHPRNKQGPKPKKTTQHHTTANCPLLSVFRVM
jgi:hypothetical protein